MKALARALWSSVAWAWWAFICSRISGGGHWHRSYLHARWKKYIHGARLYRFCSTGE